MTSEFVRKLEASWAKGRYVCIGLDPDMEKIYERVGRGHQLVRHAIEDFIQNIVYSTADVAAAYKPNMAFFERLGQEGLYALQHVMERFHHFAPEATLILDGKRGDIGDTNEAYAEELFNLYHADATTVHPYLGREANEPFLRRKDKGVFVLCRTSNPGAGEFQDLPVMNLTTGTPSPLHLHIARAVNDVWNQEGNCGLVVGATYPPEITRVRGVAQNIPLLIPGVGKQGGGVPRVVTAARHRFLINSSSGVTYPERLEGEPYQEATRRVVLALHEEITGVMGSFL